MAAFYANENFPLRVVHALRGCGHDVLTTAEAGEAGRVVTDEAVLAYATHNDHVVLTLNRHDFIRLKAPCELFGRTGVCDTRPCV